mmetsp:Transcript_65796/g.106672  ORF Transcript_65796/g.106672 Transcript_65796/m.106672 type:complete len:93 (-) Transcript_65796:56-334(-)
MIGFNQKMIGFKYSVITTTQLVKNNNEESVKQQNRTTPIQFQNSLNCLRTVCGENKRTLARPTFNQNDRIQSENDRIQILSDHNDTTCKKQQ